MKFFCYKCGDEFIPTPEELKLFSDGEIQKPDSCEECFQMENNFEPENFYSDADIGL